MALDFDMLKEIDVIVEQFNKHEIRYAICGGFAVALYGFVRATKDMDFLCDVDDVEKAEDLLRNMSYFSAAAPWTFRESQITLRRWVRASGGGDGMLHVFDLLVPPEKNKYWIKDSIQVAWGRDTTVRIVSREHLIEMKKLRNSASDRLDIIHLEENHHGCT